MTNIAVMLGQAPVKPFTTAKAVPLAAADPSLVYGIELEIEGIPVTPSEYYVPGLAGEMDNSLRTTKYGVPWEYITKPATYSVMAHILQQFFAKAKLEQARNYSERCSVHVHANVQDLTLDQLQALILLYQTFEELFFLYAGDERNNNIFCVPWSQTVMTHSLVEKVATEGIAPVVSWQKYTALNLLPIVHQGTVEFRHLPGTCDVTRIMNWLQLIGCLFAYARKTSLEAVKAELIQVNTTSEYKGILRNVFGPFEGLLPVEGLEQALEEGVLNVKYMLCSSGKKKEKSMSQLVAELQREHDDARFRAAMRPAPRFRPDARGAIPPRPMEARQANLGQAEQQLPQGEARWVIMDDILPAR